MSYYMPYELHLKIYEIDLKYNLKHMLLTLATWASDDGTGIFPGKAEIMKRASYSKKQIERNISELIERGYLFFIGIHPKYRTNIYAINMDKLSSEEEKQENSDNLSPENGQNDTPLSDKMSEEVDNLSQKVDKMTPKSINNQHKSSSNNQSSNHHPTHHPDDEEDFLNLMESDVGKLFLIAYERFPKVEERAELNQMIAQPNGCAKLVNILNRTIEKSIKPKVINYLKTSFATEPTPVYDRVKTQNKSDTWWNGQIIKASDYIGGEYASIIKS